MKTLGALVESLWLPALVLLYLWLGYPWFFL